jgi:hypothetical protein
LFNTGEACAFSERQFATVGCDFAGKDSEERRFAGTVRADQANAIPVGNSEGDILEERVGSEGFGDFLGVDDGRQCGAVSWEWSMFRVSVGTL